MLKKSICVIGACLIFVGTAFAADFTANGNDTVTDNVTGLIWQQSDYATIRTWKSALDYCNALDQAGQSDWRLPNAKELGSLVDESTYDPAIDVVMFPETFSSNYWSSTTYAGYTGYAWYVSFNNGVVLDDSKTTYNYARCVR